VRKAVPIGLFDVMTPRPPEKKPGKPLPCEDHRRIVEGDIAVTAVAGHYVIGQMTADGENQTSVEWQRNLAEALERACALAGATHRVFLYPDPAKSDYRLSSLCVSHGTEVTLSCTASRRPKAPLVTSR